jgi:solute carrier family 25 carnitine/acylcarnitine transporter 20/29
MSMVKTFIAGGGGGASLVIVGQPLDTIKVRLQADTVGQFKGVVDCAVQAIRKEGPLALYKGMVPPLAATTPMYALCFFGYGQGKKIFCDADAYDPNNLKLMQIGLAGATSAVFTTPIQAPQELLKVTLQTQTEGKFKNAADVAKHLYATGGLRALTRGFGVTLVRDASASVMYFSWYEFMKAQLSSVPGLSTDGKTNFMGSFVAGGVAGVWNWVPAIPFDRLKTKLQVAAPGAYSGAVFGSNSVLKEVMATEGIKGLFKGTAPIFIRAVPANAACFGGYEICYSALTSIGLE